MATREERGGGKRKTEGTWERLRAKDKEQEEKERNGGEERQEGEIG